MSAKIINLTFDDLRQRWAVNGRPVPVRTARRISNCISRFKIGRNWLYPETAVQEYERKNTRAGI